MSAYRAGQADQNRDVIIPRCSQAQALARIGAPRERTAQVNLQQVFSCGTRACLIYCMRLSSLLTGPFHRSTQACAIPQLQQPIYARQLTGESSEANFPLTAAHARSYEWAAHGLSEVKSESIFKCGR